MNENSNARVNQSVAIEVRFTVPDTVVTDKPQWVSGITKPLAKFLEDAGYAVWEIEGTVLDHQISDELMQKARAEIAAKSFDERYDHGASSKNDQADIERLLEKLADAFDIDLDSIVADAEKELVTV